MIIVKSNDDKDKNLEGKEDVPFPLPFYFITTIPVVTATGTFILPENKDKN